MAATPMHGYFSIGDWLIILFYLGGIIGLGVWFGKDQRTTRDYFLGSRNIPWWGIGVSIVAAETSALTIIGVPAYAFADGGNIMFIQIIVGYVIARIILAIVMVPHYLKGEIYSPYQLLEQHLGRGPRRLAAALFLFLETMAAGVRVYVADKRPVVGRHPLEPRLGVMNGLGGKGTLFAPTLARQWVNHIMDGVPFDPEVDVARLWRAPREAAVLSH